jgi:hypothetical protein
VILKKSRMVTVFVRFEIRKNENYYADKNYGGCYYLDFNRDRKNQDKSQYDNKKGKKKYNTNGFHNEKCKNKTVVSQ